MTTTVHHVPDHKVVNGAFPAGYYSQAATGEGQVQLSFVTDEPDTDPELLPPFTYWFEQAELLDQVAA